MKKVLAIGNSFSQDATALIELLSDKIYVRNMYIGGCSLKQHCEMIDTNGNNYQYQHNGEKCINHGMTLQEALKSEVWDYVTVQQVSGASGLEETYYPYLSKLIAYIKKYTNARIVLHQTWAYEKESTHPDFALYDNDQEKMWQRIEQTTRSVCRKEKLDMIGTGEMIARLRKYDFFNVSKDGISLCRDSYHLSFNYGRFAAACVWIKFFAGEIPLFLSRQDLTEGYKIIKKELEDF